MRARYCGVAVWLALVGPVAGVAEVVSYSGSAEVALTELVDGVVGESENVRDEFPGTAALPIQVRSRLASPDPDLAGAVSGAQFQDPASVETVNPQEFAINFALSSVSPRVRYRTMGNVQEVREIVFSAADLPGAVAGTPVEIRGKFFLDAALVLFSTLPARDLTGSRIELAVEVTVTRGDAAAETVLAGTLVLEGGPLGIVSATASGDLPADVFSTIDLATELPVFGVFTAAVVPSVELEYAYDASIDEPLTLTATVSVTAENVGELAGVAGAIGAPLEALQENLIVDTIDLATMKQATSAVERARSRSRAERAARAQARTVFPLLGLCGPVGLAPVALATALVGMKAGVARRRRR